MLHITITWITYVTYKGRGTQIGFILIPNLATEVHDYAAKPPTETIPLIALHLSRSPKN